MDYPFYTLGCMGLLLKVAQGILPAINEALTKNITDEAAGTTVVVKSGRQRSLAGPTLSVVHIGEDSPENSGSRDFTRTIKFKFIFLVPQIGDDLPSNFEMARQVTADLLACRLDDTDMLTPRIDTGAFGIVFAMLAQRGAIADISEFVMPDGVTTAEGFQLPWQAQFSLSRLPGTA